MAKGDSYEKKVRTHEIEHEYELKLSVNLMEATAREGAMSELESGVKAEAQEGWIRSRRAY